MLTGRPRKSALIVVDVQNDFCPRLYSHTLFQNEQALDQATDPTKRKVHIALSDDKKSIYYKFQNKNGEIQTGTMPATPAILSSEHPQQALEEDFPLILENLAKNNYIDNPPPGSLAVSGGDQVVPVINKLMSDFPKMEVVATQDWHPPKHVSFASSHKKEPFISVIKVHGQEQRLWPDHCVQNSYGAEFHRDLDTARFNKIIQKGKNSEVDSYSGYYDNDGKNATGLGQHLKDKEITDVYVAGLATDYCVRATALDAKKLGYQVYLVEDACRGVNSQTSKAAIKEMHDAGVIVIRSSWVPAIESGVLSPEIIRPFFKMTNYLEQLQKKMGKNHDYIKIGFAAQELLSDLEKARDQFFKTLPISQESIREFADTCQNAINKVREIFSEHRGIGKAYEYMNRAYEIFYGTTSPTRLFSKPTTNSLRQLESFEQMLKQQVEKYTRQLASPQHSKSFA